MSYYLDQLRKQGIELTEEQKATRRALAKIKRLGKKTTVLSK